jgi:predicted nucleotidyltransferase
MTLVLPPGTRVVARQSVFIRETDTELPAGAVAVIVKAPADATHAYRVRFPDGAEANLRRDEFSILKSVKEAMTTDEPAEIDWNRYVIYRCITGSRAYGLEVESSDVDRRGIYLPPASMQWSLHGVPEQIENDATQETYWELQKFLKLALKANPNILECLYAPLVEEATDLARELLAMREAFLSKLVYQTYNGYVLSQFKKLEQDLRARGAIKWKHAMHLIRLLLSGITVLREHHVPVRVSEHRDALLAIRNGDWSWEQVNEWRLTLHREFNEAFEKTTLPDRPDFERANRFLVKARRSMASDHPSGLTNTPRVRPPVFAAEVERVLHDTIARHPYPLLFVTVSGAHLYGFASADSDFDLRGVHVLTPREVLGLEAGADTISEITNEGLEVDLVTHDAAKFFEMMLKRNGYVLEQLYSPFILHSTPEHEELKSIGHRCITWRHAHHYLGFAETQWSLFAKEEPPRVKPLLYVFRVLLTGIHLMRHGVIEANLRALNAEARLDFVDELIERKTKGKEKETIDARELELYEREYLHLREGLERAREASSLPEKPTARRELNDLLLRVRGV